MLEICLCRGRDIAGHLEGLARLRITVFREFPYLYDGTFEYEAEYLQRYFECSDSLAVLVFDDGRLVGASTAIPLMMEQQAFQLPFLKRGIPLDEVLYFGESVLLPQYRGQGLGNRFFDEREKLARELLLPVTAFCAVDRPDEHVQKPAGYRPLHDFWVRRGYLHQPDMVARLSWPDYLPDSIEPAGDSEKQLSFWLRRR